MMRSYLVIVGSLVLFSFAYLGDNWELQKEENGIKVYTAIKEGTNFKKCKATTSIKAPLIDMYNYIRNPLNYKKFSNKIESIKVVKKTDKSVFYYMKVDMPWPVYNRDGVYELKTVEKTDKQVILKSQAHPSLMPEQDGYVRIQTATTYYKITVNGDEIDVHYEAFTDPNGNVPAWVANHYLVDGPINNFTQMKKDLEK